MFVNNISSPQLHQEFEVLNLYTLIVLMVIIVASCAEGFTEIREKCYKAEDSRKEYHEAQEFCHEFSATLASRVTDDDFAGIFDLK